MNFGKVILSMAAALVVFLLIVGGCIYSGFNKAVALDEQVSNAWAQVESQLKRRYDLIPNLVETVKGFAAQEKDIFLGIAKSREAYFQAAKAGDRKKQIQAARGLEGVLSRLLVLREQYPQLKSNENFMNLQAALEGTENRLAVERKRYNDAVRNLNTFCRKLTGRLYCSLAKVEKREYFEVSEEAKEAPKVDFTGGG